MLRFRFLSTALGSPAVAFSLLTLINLGYANKSSAHFYVFFFLFLFLFSFCHFVYRMRNVPCNCRYRLAQLTINITYQSPYLCVQRFARNREHSSKLNRFEYAETTSQVPSDRSIFADHVSISLFSSASHLSFLFVYRMFAMQITNKSYDRHKYRVVYARVIAGEKKKKPTDCKSIGSIKNGAKNLLNNINIGIHVTR